MYDGDLICVSHGLQHVRGGSALEFTDQLRQESMESNDTMATKCKCPIYGSVQCLVVLRRGLRHDSD